MEQSTAQHDAPPGLPGWEPDPQTLEVLGDLAEVAWFQVDRDRNVVAMSDRMVELTGIRREDAVGRPCIHLSRCHDCLRGCEVFREGKVDHQLTLYSRNGAEIPVAKAGMVILDEGGEPAGTLEVVRPLTAGEVDPRCLDEATREAQRIGQALAETRYNRTEAARVLGISRTTLWRKMREYGL